MVWWIWLLIVIFFVGMALKSLYEIKMAERMGIQRSMFQEG